MVRISQYKKELTEKRRVRFLIAIFSILFFIVGARLFQLQVLDYERYALLAKQQHSFYKPQEPARGKILVKDYFSDQTFTLATNEKKGMVFAIPQNVIFPGEVALKLAPILDISEDEIYKKVVNREEVYVILKRKLDREVIKKIEELDLEGIVTEWENWRFYPEDSLAANVLGFVDFEGNGQYGIENYFNDLLKGYPGFIKAEKDVFGRPVIPASYQYVEAERGADIVLTINRDIQYQAEKILKETVWRHGADSGNVIVMDPKTGKILAMANYPTFNPNNYEKTPVERFVNSNISHLWEPGSIFKPITISSALDAGKVNLETTYNDRGSVQVGGRLIHNALGRAYGISNMTDVLRLSLNCGAVFVEQQLGGKLFYQYLQKFGLGTLTGIELQGEVSGDLKPFSKLSEGDLARMSFGQAIAITPLQMIQSIAAIANDGKLMKPYIVDEIIFANGKREKTQPQVIASVISPQAAKITTGMMVQVVEAGHGTQAKVSGYKIAGKTGTAQVPKEDGLGYDPYKTVGSFVLFAPADDPKFVILVKIDNPKGVQWAESTAAPAAGKLASWILTYMQIPPTD